MTDTCISEAQCNRIARAIAEPQRLSILRLLNQKEMKAGELPRILNLSAATVSHHLHVLQVAGLINARKCGKFRWFSSAPEIWTAFLRNLGTICDLKN